MVGAQILMKWRLRTWISGSEDSALEFFYLRWQSLFWANFEFNATVSPEEVF